MVGTIGEKLKNILLADAISELKVVDKDTYELVNSFGDIW